MTRRRVVITGMGVVAANGIGVNDFWQANVQGRSGIDTITFFDVEKFETRIAGEVRSFEPDKYMPAKVAKRVDRFVHFGLASTQMALADSGLDLDKEDRERVGVIIGSGLGGLLFHEEQLLAGLKRGAHRGNPTSVPRIAPNAVSAHIAIQYGLLGPNYVISTACASSSHAIGEAFRKIQHGEADILFTGGAEAPLTRFNFGAYYAMRVMSRRKCLPQQASRPFDRERDGFVMAEGGAMLVIEELDHALERGAHIHGEIVGYGLTCGAHNMVMPRPDGDDAYRSMFLAMQDAGLAPGDIDYINAHGTSTQANDSIETRAIKKIMGDHWRRVPVSSTKSMIGHAIGAAGAIEAVVCCLALEKQLIPPTINYQFPDPECDLDYVPNQAREASISTVMSNSFGFGSVNASLLFQRYQ